HPDGRRFPGALDDALLEGVTVHESRVTKVQIISGLEPTSWMLRSIRPKQVSSLRRASRCGCADGEFSVMPLFSRSRQSGSNPSYPESARKARCPPCPPASDVRQLAEVLMVLVVAALPLAEGLVALAELDLPDPLDHLEAELVLDPQPQGRPVQRLERLAVHLVGQQRLGVHEVLQRVAVVLLAPPPPSPAQPY